MQFRVVVPDGCSESEALRIHLSDGTEANVTIPNGLFGGDSFVCDVPTEQMKNPDAILKELQQQQEQEQTTTTKPSKRQQRKQQQKNNNAHPIAEIETLLHHADDSSIKTTTSATAMIIADDKNNNNNSDPTNSNNNTRGIVASSISSSGRNFLEREIIDCQDFFLALAVGLMVGSAIVIGFLLGILHSTEAIYSVHPIEKPKTPKSLQTPRRQQQQQQQRQRSHTIGRQPQHHHKNHAPKSRTSQSQIPSEGEL